MWLDPVSFLLLLLLLFVITFLTYTTTLAHTDNNIPLGGSDIILTSHGYESCRLQLLPRVRNPALSSESPTRTNNIATRLDSGVWERSRNRKDMVIFTYFCYWITRSSGDIPRLGYRVGAFKNVTS
ncbi:hypothetical protein CBS147482_4443 [Aspergillus niger]|nr:hypothetical protein CBS147324_6173 [Aspergillus niger]KAI3011726.1 hypothetical protein CBS147482_4443 [Aspergillus niger]